MSIPYNGQLDAFELYHKIREEDARQPQQASVGLPALGHALAGSAGTAISHLILYPLDLSITRLQVQHQLRGPKETGSAASDADVEYKGIADAVRKIYKSEGGLSAFYAGCLTDTAKSIVDAFLFFLVYTYLRTRRLSSLGTKSLPVPDELGVGIVAGAFSKFITTPISQIVTRKQTAAMVSTRDPTSSVSPKKAPQLSIADIASQIRAERGIRGFWAGYRASLILTLNPALTFLFHNLLSRALLPRAKRDKPGPKLTFLLAAMSKAGASATMYPFSLAKARAQISASHSSPAVASGEEGKAYAAGSSEKGMQKKPHRQFKSSASPAQRAAHLLRAITASMTDPGPLLRSLHDTYRTEGVAALYAGLPGEVLKGFLGHGLTMLLKERIHLVIVSAYFLARKVVARGGKEGPAGGKSAGVLGDAREEMGRVARAVGAGVGEFVDGVKEGVKDVVEKIEG